MGVSIKTIANHLQVNPSTVSRALSGMPGVSESLRRRIKATAEEFGYLPDTHARDLRTQKRTSIAVVSRAHPTSVTSARNYALLDAGRRSFEGAHLVVKNQSDSLDAVVRRGISHKHAAIVLNRPGGTMSSSVLELSRSEGVALVAIDQSFDGVDEIVIDRDVGMRQVIRLFLGSGRRNVKIFSPAPVDAPDSRLSGIIGGYSEFGKSLSEVDIVTVTDPTIENGYAVTVDLLRASHDLPDALFCYSDHMAIGAVRAAVERGISIGSELAIVGFDDLDFAAYLSVSLTTVSQPIEVCAEAAMDLLTARLADPGRPTVKQRFATRLVIRESAPCPSPTMLDRVYGSVDPKEASAGSAEAD